MCAILDKYLDHSWWLGLDVEPVGFHDEPIDRDGSKPPARAGETKQASIRAPHRFIRRIQFPWDL